MNRDAEATTLIVLAVVVGRLTLEGGHQAYVRTGLFWPLVLSSLVLVAVGLLTLRRGGRDDGAGVHGVDADVHPGVVHADVDGHGHGGRVGFLLLVPVAVLALVAPAPLGAFAADRAPANQIGDPAGLALPELPEPVDGAVELPLGDVLVRTLFGDPSETTDVPLRLTGFVVPAKDGPAGSFLLTRFAVGCCAADAAPRQVLVVGAGEVPATEEWVTVVLTWDGEVLEDGSTRLPVLSASLLEPVPAPDQPYEY